MNKLFIDNESYNIEEDNITISQIKRKIYVNGKLISETNKDSVHISFTGNVKELNCNTCDIDGDAFAVHGNSVKVKGNVGGSKLTVLRLVVMYKETLMLTLLK